MNGSNPSHLALQLRAQGLLLLAVLGDQVIELLLALPLRSFRELLVDLGLRENNQTLSHFEERAIASDEKCEARAFEERAHRATRMRVR